jgi:integrase
MQRGYLYKHNGSWLLRYYDLEVSEGRTVRVQRGVRLADAKSPKQSVRLLADKHLMRLNNRETTPESSVLLLDFINDVYFSAQSSRLRPSTIKDYKDITRVHLKTRLEESKLRLRDFRTVHGQRILKEISTARPELSHTSLLRIKSFLSGVFTHAKQIGFLDGENPMVGVSVEGKRTKFHGRTYDPLEIWSMLLSGEKSANLPPVAKLVVATAALTGLRLAELRGLRWSDFDGENLHVRRSVWRTKVGQGRGSIRCAIKRSKSEIPVETRKWPGVQLRRNPKWRSGEIVSHRNRHLE